jgi:hypothetical protein
MIQLVHWHGIKKVDREFLRQREKGDRYKKIKSKQVKREQREERKK